MAGPPLTMPLSVTPKPMNLSLGSLDGSCMKAVRPSASPKEPTASTSTTSVCTLPSFWMVSTSYVPSVLAQADAKLFPRVWATTTALPAARSVGTSTDRCIFDIFDVFDDT